VICTIDYSAKKRIYHPWEIKHSLTGKKIIETKSKRRTKLEIRAKKENKMLLVQNAELSEGEPEKVQS
jgi:hypothetical protein